MTHKHNLKKIIIKKKHKNKEEKYIPVIRGKKKKKHVSVNDANKEIG